jgi:REP element-mobilizing transposase RayT
MPNGSIRSRGHLPHWEADQAVYFVTFRLADSLPKSLLSHLKLELARDPKARSRKAREVERLLESNHGACHLKNPVIADLVAEALKKCDGVRYRLFAWCVMPNHVHVVFQPTSSFRLQDILHSWKSYTAKEANKILKRSGKDFWQREYFDHLIRDEEQLDRAIHYTAENPTKAGMMGWRWVYVAPNLT